MLCVRCWFCFILFDALFIVVRCFFHSLVRWCCLVCLFGSFRVDCFSGGICILLFCHFFLRFGFFYWRGVSWLRIVTPEYNYNRNHICRQPITCMRILNSPGLSEFSGKANKDPGRSRAPWGDLFCAVLVFGFPGGSSLLQKKEQSHQLPQRLLRKIYKHETMNSVGMLMFCMATGYLARPKRLLKGLIRFFLTACKGHLVAPSGSFGFWRM